MTAVPVTLRVTPVIAWPHRMAAGRSYLVSIDLRFAPDQWPYEDEEFSLGCLLEGAGRFVVESHGETSLILHRFGGTYGPVRFVVRAAPTSEQGDAALWLTLVTAGGVPTAPIRLPVTLTPSPVHEPPDTVADPPAELPRPPAPPDPPATGQPPAPGDRHRNPFAIPHAFRPVSPLDPLRYEDHLSEYVSVGNTLVAFEQFTSALENLGPVLEAGQVVMVNGPRGCGKTSLTNRCVHWLREHGARHGLDPIVLDLRRVARDNDPMAERMRQTWLHALDAITEVPGVHRDLVALLRERDNPDFGWLNRALPADLLVIVLLPLNDIRREPVEYARSVVPRFVFLMEDRYQRPDLDEFTVNPPVYLAVRPLTMEEGKRFIEHRLARTADPAVPRLAPDAVEGYMSARQQVSIGELQRLLFGLYQQALDAPDPPEEITYADITRYFLGSASVLSDTPP